MTPVPPALAATLGRLERERRRVEATKVLFFVVGAPAGVLACAAFLLTLPLEALLLAAASVATYRLWRKTHRRVASAFKLLVVPALAAEIDPRLEYSPCGMPLEEFNSYELYRRPNRYSSQDTVSGTAGKTPIRLAMVRAVKKSGRNEALLFEGMLFMAQFNKRVRGTTRVATHEADFTGDLFGSPVELEDPRFNELFRVQSTDQIEARYILTPDMMERFAALAGEFVRVKCAFFDDRMVMGLACDYDLLDPDLSAPMDAAQLAQARLELRMLTGIAEALDLNKRIWTVK